MQDDRYKNNGYQVPKRTAEKLMERKTLESAENLLKSRQSRRI